MKEVQGYTQAEVAFAIEQNVYGTTTEQDVIKALVGLKKGFDRYWETGSMNTIKTICTHFCTLGLVVDQVGLLIEELDHSSNWEEFKRNTHYCFKA